MNEDPYRRVAGFYDRLFEPLNRGLRLAGLRMFRPRRGMRILDVGCGTGAHLDLYRRYEAELHGIDPSASMLAIARARLGDAAALAHGDASNMPYEDGFFDLEIAMLALHEMPAVTRGAVIGEMKRALKPDGRILLIDFRPGRVQFWQGNISKAIIGLSEMAAGRRHFRSYRHFMAAGGLPALAADHDLRVERERLAAGGAFGLYLLSDRAGWPA